MYSECILKCLLTDVSLLASMAVRGGVTHRDTLRYMYPTCLLGVSRLRYRIQYPDVSLTYSKNVS